MDIQFFDPDDLPRPREEVRLRGLKVQPYPDGRRVRVEVQITPFQDRPNLDLEVLDPDGHEVASLNVIESIDHQFDITVHLRGPQPKGKHKARLVLYYPETDFRDQLESDFDVTPPS